MNTPAPRPQTHPPTQPEPAAPFVPDAARMRQWLTLRRELAELHARLEYLKLMAALRVWR